MIVPHVPLRRTLARQVSPDLPVRLTVRLARFIRGSRQCKAVHSARSP
ncbi:hypothetical protein PXO_02278 [Xanthomonas oryzae pv. oryzae PXO99A]|uniref:Uncharacterized protein n=1 Tax=Xanthomonas oryzae pv. oryzae (strain PXO99A) TaxID=360094 RepID=A0A0K0GNG4_XANOP|nr:hypothetical protein PXO_02278 [Xanthomonas oryzae pv. oryzae PXO99A]